MKLEKMFRITKHMCVSKNKSVQFEGHILDLI